MVDLINLVMVPAGEESSRSSDWKDELKRLKIKPIFSADLRAPHPRDPQVSDTMKIVSYRTMDGTINGVLIDTRFLPPELYSKMRNHGVRGYVLGEEEGFIFYV
ncbi:MAG: hypothetical protein KKH88_03695 [Nanoarchaeota archaeon]|nr:hypothetical protein [Nanoarchaeota archaeon]